MVRKFHFMVKTNFESRYKTNNFDLNCFNPLVFGIKDFSQNCCFSFTP